MLFEFVGWRIFCEKHGWTLSISSISCSQYNCVIHSVIMYRPSTKHEKSSKRHEPRKSSSKEEPKEDSNQHKQRPSSPTRSARSGRERPSRPDRRHHRKRVLHLILYSDQFSPVLYVYDNDDVLWASLLLNILFDAFINCLICHLHSSFYFFPLTLSCCALMYAHLVRTDGFTHECVFYLL